MVSPPSTPHQKRNARSPSNPWSKPKGRFPGRSSSWPPSSFITESKLRCLASAAAAQGTQEKDSSLVSIKRVWDFLSHDVLVVYLLAHKPVHRMKRVHIHAICHLSLMIVAIGYALSWLQSVLLPILMAAGLAVVMEPIIFVLIDPWVRCFGERPGVQAVLDQDGHLLMSPTGTRGSMKLQHSSLREKPSDFKRPECGGALPVAQVFRRIWCVLVVTAALFALICVICGIGFWIISNIQDVDWNKYVDGEKMNWIKKKLAEHGATDFDKAVKEAVAFMIENIGIQILGSTLAALTGFLLMLLFLAFFLIDSATERSVSDEPWRHFFENKIKQQVTERIAASLRKDQSSLRNSSDCFDSVLMIRDDFQTLAGTVLDKLRKQMRVYIKAKFWLSILKAVLIGTVMAVLAVDLWPVWTLLTFILNFMPLGSAISTLAPVPFIFLDPGKEFIVVAICIMWPVLVHNGVGNVVEPRVFANSLNLHPVTVLMALTFWTALWGVLGAIVCVPITAMIRVGLYELKDHPYSSPIIGLMEGSLPVSSSEESTKFPMLLAKSRSKASCDQ